MYRLALCLIALSLAAPAAFADDPFAPKNAIDAAKQLAQGWDKDDPFRPENAIDAVKAEPIRPKAKNSPKTAARIDFEVAVTPQRARPGEVVKLTITGKPRPSFHTYPITQRTPQQPEEMLSSIAFEETPGLKPIPGINEEPAPEFVKEGTLVLLEYSHAFTWKQEIAVLPDAKPGNHSLTVHVRVQVCDSTCVWGTHDFDVPIEVEDAPAAVLAPALQQRLQAPPPPIRIVPVPGNAALPPDVSPGGNAASSGILAFMLTGIFWGAVSLVTPCVFPMIPITVSFFLKQSEKEHHRPVTMALVYCSTIVVVLTISAIALLSLFREFSTTPLMNFAIGGLFLFFSLSLFGMYEIELPSGLARFTAAREGKGGLVGTMFMALTFTIISFACVAPFLGGFGGTATDSSITWTHRVLGGLAFSLTFASPFFVLALFPALLKKMPKSGNWLNAVKVVMGFLELAAALKFFRAGELVFRPEPQFFTYDFVLGLYIALSLLCGLYLLNLYRLPHDTPADHLPVPQLIVSFLFLGLGLYLTPALFKNASTGQSQRPSGAVFAWLDSFLLPDTKSELPWDGDLSKGLAAARAKGQLVFVDFTGVVCTNCRLNEETVFIKESVRDLLHQYTLVQLYTDKVPNNLYPPAERAKLGAGTTQQRADAAKNLALQRKYFDTEQLPLYAILAPKAVGEFDVVAVYDEGKINDEAAFINFLSQPLSRRQEAVTAQFIR